MSARTILSFGVAIGIAAAQTSGNSHPLYFRHMDIYPTSLAVTLRDPILGIARPAGEFFAPSVSPGGGRSTDHYINGELYNTFSTDSDFLFHRKKVQELVSGAFGSVYAWTDYYYRDSSAHAITFSVHGYANRLPHESPVVVSALPTDPFPGLDAVSVIRVFPAKSGFIVASGQYSREGLLDNIVLDGAIGGDWIHQNRIDELDETLKASSVDHMSFQKTLGFPSSLRISDLLAGTAAWDSIDRPILVTLVNFHYDRNSWVRQDSITPTGDRTTRFLAFRLTAQDRMLDIVDRGLMFRPAVSRR